MIFPPVLAFAGGRFTLAVCRFCVKVAIFAFAVYVEFSSRFLLHNKLFEEEKKT